MDLIFFNDVLYCNLYCKYLSWKSFGGAGGYHGFVLNIVKRGSEACVASSRCHINRVYLIPEYTRTLGERAHSTRLLVSPFKATKRTRRFCSLLSFRVGKEGFSVALLEVSVRTKSKNKKKKKKKKKIPRQKHADDISKQCSHIFICMPF